jgi:hypothetical protein
MINVGTLVSSAIRPNNSLDPIASAFASEIKGGLHTVQNTTDRNAIIFERREWGMMCYSISDNLTYQLEYGLQDTNIMNNNNWTPFSGGGSGGGNEWIDSVLSVLYIQPASPINGNRYLVGLGSLDLTPITGVIWSAYQSGQVVEWNSTLAQWEVTVPSDGMSVRVDNDDNSIYRYEGVFPSGYWEKERVSQIRSISVTTPNGLSYSTSEDSFDQYYTDMILLTQFSQQNISTTASLNINGLGNIIIRKTSQSGLVSLTPFDIQPNIVYSLIYDGTYFQLNIPFSNVDNFNVKYYIEPIDYIVVPQYYQYWVYSDLEIAGILVNYGQVIIANGSMILSGGTFSNYGQLSFINFDAGLTTSYNNSDTIQFTQSNTIYGLSVSATIANGSLTASHLNTNNQGATAGYILSVNGDGTFAWIESTTSSSITGATNGLSNLNNEIGLGGTLSQTTTLDGDGNDILFLGMDNFIINSNNYLLQGDGLVSIDSGSGSIQLIGENGFVTIGNGEGLVYTDDYSGTFITHSLVDKNYVDNLLSIIGNLSYSDKNFIISSTISGNGQWTGLNVSSQPLSGYIQVYLNGLECSVGYGSTTSSPFYFSNDGGITSKVNIDLGDSLYYNESVLGFGSLDIGFRISLNYLE